MPISINLCDTKNCGEVFNTYFCKKCEEYIQTQCKYCHKIHFDAIDRMKELSGLKRNFHA